jgi:hypothetical protein
LATGGTPITIQVNSFVTTVPEKIIHHYDGMLFLPCLGMFSTHLFLNSRHLAL